MLPFELMQHDHLRIFGITTALASIAIVYCISNIKFFKQDRSLEDKPLVVGVIGAGAVGCVSGLKLIHGDPTGKRIGKVILGGRNSFEDCTRKCNGKFKICETFEGGKTKLFDYDDERIQLANTATGKNLSEFKNCDVIIVATKANDTEEVAIMLSNILDDQADTTVISLQNGLDNTSILERHLKTNKNGRRITILRGVVAVSTTWEEASTTYTVNTNNGKISLERPTDRRDVARLGTLITSWSCANLKARTSEHIVAIQHIKFIVNLINPINALLGTTVPVELMDHRIRRVWAAAIREAVRQISIRNELHYLANDMDRWMFWIVGMWIFPTLLTILPNAVWIFIFSSRKNFGPNYKSSMLHDLERRRKTTEIEELCGLVVKIGQTRASQSSNENATLTSTPINLKLLELVRAAQKEGRGSPCLSHEALYRSLCA